MIARRALAFVLALFVLAPALAGEAAPPAPIARFDPETFARLQAFCSEGCYVEIQDGVLGFVQAPSPARISAVLDRAGRLIELQHAEIERLKRTSAKECF